MSFGRSDTLRSVTWVAVLALFCFPMIRVGLNTAPVFWDDISIVFVYAHNFVQTGSFFYSTPADRIDGFTSMLDVLLMAPFAAADYAHMFTWNYYFKALLTSAVPVALWCLLRSHGVSFLHATLVAFAVAVSEVLAHAFAMQVEGPVYALLLLLFFWQLFGESRARTVLLALSGFVLCITRPEAMLLVPAALAAFALLLRGDQRCRGTIVAGALFASALLAWLAWRIYYFGYWAPNSYYAKMSGSRLEEIRDGLSFITDYFFRSTDVFVYLAPLVLLVPLGVRVLHGTTDRRPAYFLIALGVSAVMLGVRIGTGGDSYWMLSRLMIDSAIPAAIALGIGLSVCQVPSVRAITLVLACLAIVGNAWIIVSNLPGNIGGFVRLERRVNASLRCEKEALERAHLLFPDARLAHTDFQRAKYFQPDLQVVDLSGLNSRVIAHSVSANVNKFGKHNFQIALDGGLEFWSLGPGILKNAPLTEIYWNSVLDTGRDPEGLFVGATSFLQSNAPRLRQEYSPLAIKTSCGNYLNLLVSRTARPANSTLTR